MIQRQYVTVTKLPGYDRLPLARCGESLRSSNRLVSLRGPVRADEAASHAAKRIAVAAVDNTTAAKLQPMNRGIRIKCRN